MKLGKKDLQKTADQLYERMFRKWYSGYDTIFETGGFYFVVDKADKSTEFIKKLLNDGYDVRTGYICTCIRDSRDFFIMYR